VKDVGVTILAARRRRGSAAAAAAAALSAARLLRLRGPITVAVKRHND